MNGEKYFRLHTLYTNFTLILMCFEYTTATVELNDDVVHIFHSLWFVQLYHTLQVIWMDNFYPETDDNARTVIFISRKFKNFAQLKKIIFFCVCVCEIYVKQFLKC